MKVTVRAGLSKKADFQDAEDACARQAELGKDPSHEATGVGSDGLAGQEPELGVSALQERGRNVCAHPQHHRRSW